MSPQIKSDLANLQLRKLVLVDHMEVVEELGKACHHPDGRLQALKALQEAGLTLARVEAEIDRLLDLIKVGAVVRWGIGANWYVALQWKPMYNTGTFTLVQRDTVIASGGYDMVPHLWITEALIGRS